MTKEKKCSNIDWEGLEVLLGKMSDQESEAELEEAISLIGLSIIMSHVSDCEECGEKLDGLFEEHGIDEGIIFEDNSLGLRSDDK